MSFPCCAVPPCQSERTADTSPRTQHKYPDSVRPSDSTGGVSHESFLQGLL